MVDETLEMTMLVQHILDFPMELHRFQADELERVRLLARGSVEEDKDGRRDENTHDALLVDALCDAIRARVARRDQPEWACMHCHGHDVEVCLPAWQDPNADWAFTQEDEGAEPLNTFCNACGENHDLYNVKDPSDTIHGRWN